MNEWLPHRPLLSPNRHFLSAGSIKVKDKGSQGCPGSNPSSSSLLAVRLRQATLLLCLSCQVQNVAMRSQGENVRKAPGKSYTFVIKISRPFSSLMLPLWELCWPPWASKGLNSLETRPKVADIESQLLPAVWPCASHFASLGLSKMTATESTYTITVWSKWVNPRKPGLQPGT